MADAAEALELKPGGWSAFADVMLGPLAADRPGGVDHVRERVQSGVWALDYVMVGGETVGLAVTAMERQADGLALVIWYAAGGAPGRDLVAEALPLLEARARRRGAVRAQFWTRRPGLFVKAARQGYGEPEILMEKGI